MIIFGFTGGPTLPATGVGIFVVSIIVIPVDSIVVGGDAFNTIINIITAATTSCSAPIILMPDMDFGSILLVKIGPFILSKVPPPITLVGRRWRHNRYHACPARRLNIGNTRIATRFCN